MHCPIFCKPLTALASLVTCGAIAVVALATTEAPALSLNGVHVSPAMGHVDTLGGGFGPHTDRVFGPGGESRDVGDCHRRTHRKLRKLDVGTGSEHLSDEARRRCGN
jgi:hypothetical protein